MPTEIESDIPMRALLAGARRKERSLLDLTRKLVAAESPSDTKSAVDGCVALAAAHSRQLGGRVKFHRQQDHGNILEAHFRSPLRALATPEQILLLGHLDTVWPVGTLESMPCRLRDGRLWGPGTLDMKAGVAMALTAIEMLAEAELLHREIILLLNGDEEIGSPASRPITEKLARECAPSTCWSPRRDWPTRPRARVSATGTSRSQAWLLMPAWTSKKAQTPSANWRA